VAKGEGLVICGANGVGKTSILRVLKGLWPAAGVGARADIAADTMFLPQTPYR
jgi:ABC-type uncharacterized transport system fused permease/ATPase subunit